MLFVLDDMLGPSRTSLCQERELYVLGEIKSLKQEFLNTNALQRGKYYTEGVEVIKEGEYIERNYLTDLRRWCRF